MLEISSVDTAIVGSLLEHNVLVSVDSYRLDQSQGVIVLTCGDGDQSHDIFSYHVQLQEGRCNYPHPRIHLCAWNGGALRINPTSATNRTAPGAADIFLAEVLDASDLKAIPVVVTYCHIPCGKAYAAHMNAKEVLEENIQAKKIIKARKGGIKAACFVQVCREGKKRSYYLVRERWEVWLANVWPNLVLPSVHSL